MLRDLTCEPNPPLNPFTPNNDTTKTQTNLRV